MKMKIEQVKIERKIDENPDTSFLGEYTSKPQGWRVDRQKGELQDDNGLVLATDVPASHGHGEYQYIHGFQHDGPERNWAHVTDKEVCSGYLHARYKANGAKQVHYTNAFAEFGVIGWEIAHTRQDKVRVLSALYCCLDASRLRQLERGDFCYIGVIAKAEIRSATGTGQVIRSGGLWGVESDAGDYLREVEKGQLGELQAELEELGFKKRAIAHAFTNVDKVPR